MEKRDPQTTTPSFPTKRVRMVRPGYLGILISSQGPEYVMPVSEANDLVGLIYRAKHDGLESELIACLSAFVSETVDYMTRNNLGDPEQQHNVKWARSILP